MPSAPSSSLCSTRAASTAAASRPIRPSPPPPASCSWTPPASGRFSTSRARARLLRAEELDRSQLFAGRALHLAGALVLEELDGEPAADLLAEAKSHGLVTSLDTVWDATGRWERVLPLLPHVDLFAPSLPEGRAITGEHEPVAVAAWLRARGVGAVVLKCGDSGCYASGDGFEGAVRAFPVAAVDGTGAGDAFVAGLLYGRLAGWGLERSARFANAVGAFATTAIGAVEGVRGLEETLALAGLAEPA